MSGRKTCPIDGGEMRPVFSATVLNKYSVQYYLCDTCSFLQTEDPYWLEEAYNDAIAECDTGIMERNIHNVVRVSAVLELLKMDKQTIVDIAGGYGILTRLLRDVGFDCRWSDKYCKNIMAKGFEAAHEQKAAAICALEILEHVENPLMFLRDAISKYDARAIVFSTMEFTSVPDKDWWYYSFNAGQHISFYSRQSLKALAMQLGWFYTPLPRHLHLLTDTPMHGLRSVIMRSIFLYPYALWSILKMRSQSRTQTDNTPLPRGK